MRWHNEVHSNTEVYSLFANIYIYAAINYGYKGVLFGVA